MEIWEVLHAPMMTNMSNDACQPVSQRSREQKWYPFIAQSPEPELAGR